MTGRRPNGPDVRRVAREEFGFDVLRAGQEAAVRSVLDGHDTLAILPTGGGKSLIYRIAAELIPGPTVVVSPLIALQADQVGAIGEGGGGEAALVNSTIGEPEREAALDGLRDGRVEFLFLAPEQFDRPDTLERLRADGLSLFVVDEAHCISDWGHDFRPAYLRLGTIVEALGHPPVLALTATAAPPVRAEILERLGMRDPRVLVRGFDRPNLHLAVERFPDAEARDRALVKRALTVAPPAIVYTATRRRAEGLAGRIAAAGVPAAAYHAGLAARERDRVQDAFMAGEVPIIVATTAFGMGIDKPDIRVVLHAEPSESLDAYYQEIGRAGRDGEPARAVLFYRPEDLGLRRFFASAGRVGVAEVRRVLRALVEAGARRLDRDDLARRTRLSRRRLGRILDHLGAAGVVEVEATGGVHGPGAGEADAAALGAEIAQSDERRRRIDASRVEMMRDYAEAGGCRREVLLAYFGETIGGACGNCDQCDARADRAPEAGEGAQAAGAVAEGAGVAEEAAGAVAEGAGVAEEGAGAVVEEGAGAVDEEGAGAVDEGATGRERSAADPNRPFAVDSPVVHATWGEGLVLRYEGDRVIVLFEDVGYKTLALTHALEEGLLRARDM